MPYEFNDFLKDWEPQYIQVKSILDYLHTYPELLSKLQFGELLRPEELDIRQQDWVHIITKYEGLEKGFFKPYWVPISKNSLDIFIDLSDNEFPVFEMEFFFFEPYHYFKTFLFYKITDLLLAAENGINIKEFEEQRISSIFTQSDIFFEMRKRLGLSNRSD